MKKLRKVTLIHPDDNSKYKMIEKKDMNGIMRGDTSKVKLSAGCTPSWEQQGMEIFATPVNSNDTFSGLVKSIETQNKRRMVAAKVYKLMTMTQLGGP